MERQTHTILSDVDILSYVLTLQTFVVYVVFVTQSTMQETKCRTCGRGGKPRSTNQNSYMWGVVYQIMAEETGHTTEEIHDCCKSMFLPRSLFLGDQEINTSKSTTILTTAELEDYLRRVRIFAQEQLNCFIPLPNEAPIPF